MPVIQIPCLPVTSHLHTTVPEIKTHVEGCGAIGEYLANTFYGYSEDHFGWSKVIWDISATAWLVNSAWVPTVVEHSPILTDQVTWSRDVRRHFIRTATSVDRDEIFRDLFRKLQGQTQK